VSVRRLVILTPTLAFGLLGLLGCASTTHYTSAKPLAPGQSEFVLSVDATRVEDHAAGTDRRGVDTLNPSSDGLPSSTPSFAQRKDVSTTFVGVPTFRFRRGILEGVQLGGFLGGRGIGAELLVGLLRGPTSVAWLLAPMYGGKAAYLDAPLLVSRTLGDRVELLASLGPVLGQGPSNDFDATTGLLARLGVGVRVRFNSWLFVHPECVAAESISRPLHDTWLSAGLGLGGAFR
jgi:hypothetical protein